jgi:hypothetical protein
MKNISLYLMFFCFIALTSCEIDEQFDPNGPSISSVTGEASAAELNLMVAGATSRMRVGWDTYCTSTGTISRELYLFDADPRNTEDLLGKDGVSLDNNTFYLTASYGGRYQTVKNCNILLEAVENATGDVSEAQKQGYRGFANTIKALMFLHELARLNDNGIRIDVADPANLGPIVGKAEAYAAILNLLDEANTQLQGAEFNFTLQGFGDFGTPSGFAQFNRAVAVRAALYEEDYPEVLRILPNSFFDLDAPLDLGPQHIYSTSAGDFLNNLFKAPDQNGDQIIVHDSYIADILPNDTRINKFRLRSDPTSQDGLNGTHATNLYASALSPISIIRNEELILSYAEAKIQTDAFDDAVEALNVIRNAHGLDDYTGGVNRDALIDEMLYQRRYSFWAEGHRMFDLRRYGRLSADFLPIDRDGDQVFTQFPLPLNETP